MLEKISSNQLGKVEEQKLPSKEERKKQKEEQERINDNIKDVKIALEEFVVEKVLPLKVPVDIVDQIPDLLKSLINIYKTSSNEWQAFLDAREKLSLTDFCDLTKKND